MNIQADQSEWQDEVSCQTEEIKFSEAGCQTKEMMKNEKKDKNEGKPLPKSKLQTELEKSNQKNEQQLIQKDDQLRELKKRLKEMQK